jgi:hypothetical protein
VTAPTHTVVARVRSLEVHGQNVWGVGFHAHDDLVQASHRTVLDILALSLTRGLEVTVEIDTASSEIRNAQVAAGARP